MNEEWRDVVGFEGLYEVSNFGVIRNRHGLSLTPAIHHLGYYQLGLWKDGTRKNLRLHRVVAEAFFEDFNEYPQVDHIDGDLSNNSLDNLRMATQSQNKRAYSKTWGMSLFRGVSKHNKKWRARLTLNNKTKSIGSFDTEEEAAAAWNEAATSNGFFMEALNNV